MAAINEGGLDVDWLLHSKKGRFAWDHHTCTSISVTCRLTSLFARFTLSMHVFHFYGLR